MRKLRERIHELLKGDFSELRLMQWMKGKKSQNRGLVSLLLGLLDVSPLNASDKHFPKSSL